MLYLQEYAQLITQLVTGQSATTPGESKHMALLEPLLCTSVCMMPLYAIVYMQYRCGLPGLAFVIRGFSPPS